jgi:hypothetical protein
LTLVYTLLIVTGLTDVLLGDKKKTYLQRLEGIAMGARTAPTPPSSHNDESPEHIYPRNNHSSGSGPAFNNDMCAGGLRELSPHPCPLINHEVGNELDLPSSLSEFPRYDQTMDESFNESERGVDFLVENSVFPPPADFTLALDSDNIYAWRPRSADQYIGGTAEDEFPRNHENNQQAPARFATQAPFSPSRLSNVLLSEDGVSQKYTLEDIMVAGIRALSEGESQPKNDTRPNSQPTTVAGTRQNLAPAANLEQCYTPGIHLNTIQLTTMSFVAACFANAAMLELSTEALWSRTSQSPFYQAQIANYPSGTAIKGQFAHLKPLLRPSSTQLAHPHHPYLDILPFPAFRNRIIQLLQVQPPPFDPEKLCQDLKSDGLICWGSTKRDGQDTVGSGAPWDIRSWEIKPWFLTKWWFLFDGPDGEMCQHSRWWSELRGEKSSYPW